MVRGFLAGENHFFEFPFMRSDWTKNIFLKVAWNSFQHISRLIGKCKLFAHFFDDMKFVEFLESMKSELKIFFKIFLLKVAWNSFQNNSRLLGQ